VLKDYLLGRRTGEKRVVADGSEGGGSAAWAAARLAWSAQNAQLEIILSALGLEGK
jgi:hypothetical protein